MRKLGKGLVTLICVAGLVIMFGCAGMQDIATPIHIDKAAIEYAGVEATSYLPWTTVWDSRRVLAYMNYMHTQTQVAYKRLQQDDNLTHAFLLNSVEVNLADAVGLQKQLFDPTGPIGLLLPALFGTGIGAMFIPRKRERDLEKQLNGKS
jgi:hypothetical protein